MIAVFFAALFVCGVGVLIGPRRPEPSASTPPTPPTVPAGPTAYKQNIMDEVSAEYEPKIAAARLQVPEDEKLIAAQKDVVAAQTSQVRRAAEQQRLKELKDKLEDDRKAIDRLVREEQEARGLRADRLPPLARCVELAASADWGGDLTQIPATVIDTGVLKHVPYQSHRAGDYELNVYGDPDSPACVEIGATGAALRSAAAKGQCVAFMASLLADPGDRSLLRSLKLGQDLQKRGGLTFEVTPETAPDAYGGWWVSVYDTAALDRSRASPPELAAITVPKEAPAPAAPAPTYAPLPWSPRERELARPGGKTVYVRSYVRKDGTYVQAHTRAAPGSGRKR
jgi:hypothetical protein